MRGRLLPYILFFFIFLFDQIKSNKSNHKTIPHNISLLIKKYNHQTTKKKLKHRHLNQLKNRSKDLSVLKYNKSKVQKNISKTIKKGKNNL